MILKSSNGREGERERGVGGEKERKGKDGRPGKGKERMCMGLLCATKKASEGEGEGGRWSSSKVMFV